MNKTLFATALLGCGAMVFSACGGDNDELSKALEELRQSDLSTMVLPPDAYGNIANGFSIDPDSGFQDNAEAAEASMNPDDTAGDFSDAGRITGYAVNLEADEIIAMLLSGTGIITIESEVELYEDAESASQYLARTLAEFNDYEGEDVGGLIVGPNTLFDVAEIGDESGGLEFSGSLPAFDVTLYGTVVYFRIGRVEAVVIFSAIDDQDLRADAEAAARKLDERIRGVLLGEIDEDPVEIPTEEVAETQPVDRPEDVPDLAKTALQLFDLPAGFEIDAEAYEPLPDFEFEREFGTGDRLTIELGRTAVVSIQNTVTVYGSSDEARFILSGFVQLLTGDAGRDFFATMFAQGAGFEPDVRELQSVPLNLGEESVAVLGLVETGLGDFAFTFMLVRDGAAVSLITVTALAGSFDFQDLVPLARIAADRLALGPQD